MRLFLIGSLCIVLVILPLKLMANSQTAPPKKCGKSQLSGRCVRLAGNERTQLMTHLKKHYQQLQS